ncbi:hypothetical protein B0H34DRAFT_679490 [Crassisporium funariophilum]|nr:hypothetical protein B0H34DRAFT_679490 [Crassisporium funariophilum]
MPVRKGGKHQAALQREAGKRGETLPEQRPKNQSLLSDPTYVDSTSENSDSDVEIVDAPSASGNSDPTTRTDDLGTKRKLRRENADLIPETATKIARTTAWRNEKGKTKKAHAIAMQPSVALFFRKTTSFFNDTENDMSKQQETHVARQEEEEEDRVIEIIGKQHVSVHAAEVPDLRRVEVEPPMSMEAVNEVFNVPFTIQPPRAQADVDYADAAPPSMAMDVDILIDPFLLQLSDPAHHTAVFQRYSVPSSASPSQNASNITKTASTDASPSIAGTRAVDSVSSADANASTAPKDKAGDKSDMEAPPDKPHELHQQLGILIKAQQKKLKKKKSLVVTKGAPGSKKNTLGRTFC